MHYYMILWDTTFTSIKIQKIQSAMSYICYYY